jgi:NAD(P)-dependent dehydrogenase (short-subunit alcohol dehydrogenase family)
MLDVTDEASVQEALGQVGDRLTAVVNNAGVAVGGPVE